MRKLYLIFFVFLLMLIFSQFSYAGMTVDYDVPDVSVPSEPDTVTYDENTSDEITSIPGFDISDTNLSEMNFPTTTYSGGTIPGHTLTSSDPVSMSNGEYINSWDLIDLGGNIDIFFTLYYDPNFPDKLGNFPVPWQFAPTDNPVFTSNLIMRLYDNGTNVKGVIGNVPFLFKYNSTSQEYENQMPDKFVLKKISGKYYILDRATSLIYYFEPLTTNDNYAVVKFVVDRNSNFIVFEYNSNLLAKVYDIYGRELNLIYDNGNRLIKVYDKNNREISFNYTQVSCGGGNNHTYLTSITDVEGNVIAISYDTENYDSSTGECFLIKKVIYPENNYHIENSWCPKNPNGKYAICSQTDPFGNKTSFEYSVKEDYMTIGITYPDNSTREFDVYNGSFLYAVTDEAGKKIYMSRKDSGEIEAFENRNGDISSMTYNEYGLISSITNSLNQVIKFEYSAQSQIFGEATFTFYNLTKITYPDDTTIQFYYDSNGNRTSYKDRNGNQWNFSYNSNGLITQITNPENGWIKYSYNQDGTISQISNSDGEIDKYSYDDYKRVIKVEHSDLSFYTIEYNLNDLITKYSDELGNSYNYTYNKNSILTKVTKPDNSTIEYVYDQMDRIIQIKTSSNSMVSISYDSRGRMNKIINNGTKTGYEFNYDSRGWLTQIIDYSSRNTFSITYNDEGIITQITSPEGKSVKNLVNSLGLSTEIKNSSNKSCTITRDTETQLIKKISCPDETLNFYYDSEYNLIKVSKSSGQTIEISRNKLGLITKIKDPTNHEWQFSFTTLGRLSEIIDPLNNITQYSYNDRGLIDKITYSDNSYVAFNYDEAGRMIKKLSENKEILYAYDSLGRLSSTYGLSFQYDSDGNYTSTEDSVDGVNFRATFDSAKRINSAIYFSNSEREFTVTYYYDSNGSLSMVSDSLTNTKINISYNNDGEITKIDRPDNSLDTEFTYNQNGIITKIVHGNYYISYYYDSFGYLSKETNNLPDTFNPYRYFTGFENTYSYNDSSQINENLFKYDTRGRRILSPDGEYSWDSFNRLVSTPFSQSIVYNGLNNVIEDISIDGTIHHFYYNYGLGMDSIVAEKIGDTYYYFVLLPGGMPLYMIDSSNNSVYFFHFDIRGNTIFLSDINGNITDSYVYDIYGTLLNHTGTSPNPFTFLGAYQVRKEPIANGIYQVHARYYDSSTGSFISKDPMWPVLDFRKLCNANPYQYAAQNPVMYSDYTGLSWGIASLWRKFKEKAKATISGIWAADPREAEIHAMLETAGGALHGTEKWKNTLNSQKDRIKGYIKDKLGDAALNAAFTDAFGSAKDLGSAGRLGLYLHSINSGRALNSPNDVATELGTAQQAMDSSLTISSLISDFVSIQKVVLKEVGKKVAKKAVKKGMKKAIKKSTKKTAKELWKTLGKEGAKYIGENLATEAAQDFIMDTIDSFMGIGETKSKLGF